MRELTVFETRETAGGIFPIVIALVASVVGHYIYDPAGPKKGGGDKESDESQG